MFLGHRFVINTLYIGCRKTLQNFNSKNLVPLILGRVLEFFGGLLSDLNVFQYVPPVLYKH
uniref:Uncharacterized protein n=1 Tax=Octopus bimaculoides TaxID=37653 RepID=A0A0L8FRE2_OCTBM